MADLRMIGKKGLREIIPFLSPVQIWRLERAGKFPQRVQVSPNRVGWFLHEIESFLKTRPTVTPDCRPKDGVK